MWIFTDMNAEVNAEIKICDAAAKYFRQLQHSKSPHERMSAAKWEIFFAKEVSRLREVAAPRDTQLELAGGQ